MYPEQQRDRGQHQQPRQFVVQEMQCFVMLFTCGPSLPLTQLSLSRKTIGLPSGLATPSSTSFLAYRTPPSTSTVDPKAYEPGPGKCAVSLSSSKNRSAVW